LLDKLVAPSLRLPLGFTVATWNIRSFRPKKHSVLLLARNNNLAILALQETHCKADSWPPKLTGYKVFSVPAAERGSVGLALAIKTGIPSTLLEKSENWIISEVKMANCDWVVANIYFPSGGMNHAV
jgi:exonuclease III